MKNNDNYLHTDLSDKIIKGFYNVYNILGFGFLEKVYEKALFHELTEMGLFVECQKQLKVYYKEFEVGEYYADLIVEGSIIVELKAAETLCEKNEVQLTNYLKATDMEVGLLLNFGKKPQFKRKVVSNKRWFADGNSQ